MTPKDIFLTVALPAIIMLCAVLTARLPGMGDSFRSRRERLSLFGVTCAFIVGTRFVIGKWPDLPPATADEWLSYLALAACLVSMAAATLIHGKAWPFAGAALSFVFGACVALLPLRTALMTQVDSTSARLGMGALAATLAAIPMIATGQSALRVTHAGPVLALLAATAIGAPGHFFGASVKFAQIAGILAVCSGVLTAAALFFKKWEISRGTAGTIAGLNATLWMLTYAYSTVPLPAAILGALSPSGAAVSFLPGLERRPRLCIALQFILSAAVAAVATAIAFQAMPKDDDLYG